MRVKLLSHTESPVATMFLIWENSRVKRNLPGAQQIQGIYDYYRDNKTKTENTAPQIVKNFNGADLMACAAVILYEFPEDVEALKTRSMEALVFRAGKYIHDTVEKLLTEGVPVTENIQFVFLIEDMSVSFREQLVRHRIGTQVGPNLGVDIVPDLAESTFWIQSMRMLNMGQFASDKNYILPQSVNRYAIARIKYNECMEKIQETYNFLVNECDVPEEDARNVLPLATTHRGTWGVNLKALQHVIGKRSCWVSQLNMWSEFIAGATEEVSKIDPIFQQLTNPPCIKGSSTWTGCPFEMMNYERIQGRDPFPPCPLFLTNEQVKASLASKAVEAPAYHQEEDGYWAGPSAGMGERMQDMQEAFSKLWGRNPLTGRLPFDPQTTPLKGA